jgi:DNA-directed RNA polymerase specialized sigma24 family protein
MADRGPLAAWPKARLDGTVLTSYISPMSIESQLSECQGYLLRFARLQLRNDAWAEDAVSETIPAALSNPQSFANRSQLKTWLVGILKHKVIDILRQRQREVSFQEDDGDGSEELNALVQG